MGKRNSVKWSQRNFVCVFSAALAAPLSLWTVAFLFWGDEDVAPTVLSGLALVLVSWRPGVLSNRRLMQLHWRAVEKINAQGLSIGRIQTSGPFCAIDLCTPMEYNLVMTFVETKLFTSRILDAMSDDEYAALQHYLANRPDAGAVIPGAGGVRKVRWSGSGRGKRGGSRLIYYWDCGDRILMLYVYLKNERENLTEEQKKLMRQIAEGYKHE